MFPAENLQWMSWMQKLCHLSLLQLSNCHTEFHMGFMPSLLRRLVPKSFAFSWTSDKLWQKISHPLVPALPKNINHCYPILAIIDHMWHLNYIVSDSQVIIWLPDLRVVTNLSYTCLPQVIQYSAWVQESS